MNFSEPVMQFPKNFSKIIEILSNFDSDSKAISCKPYGNGHINKTYDVKTEKGGHYILQQVNNNVFKDVDMLMKNINYVSSYLIGKGYESLHIIKTKDGKLLIYVSEGRFTEDEIEDGYFGCAGVAEIPDLQNKLIKLGYGGFKHHTTIGVGHMKKVLYEAITRYLHYDFIDID